ncbi:MAG: hypothetical protein HY698_02615 [Deltaproteobacteria bacterium]|nr:hypothetical protein [Deltaproteobacteria bacterium]
MTRTASERGSALVVVMMVTLVLLGLGLMSLRQVRTELSSSGHLRTSRQAYQAAHSGLVRSSLTVLTAPDYFHRMAVQASPSAPSYLIGSDAALSTPGVFALADPFGAAVSPGTGDEKRVGTLEYRASMQRPRLAPSPAGFQVAGGTGNRFVFYTYEFDVLGWVNRAPGGLSVDPGTSGARKHMRADVRVGPIALNQ